MRRMILPTLFGLAGAVALAGLGVWQLQRLAWKEGVLAEIEARVSAKPQALPEIPDPDAHLYLPVRVEGILAAETVRALVGRKRIGAGYRLISTLEVADGRRVMVDRGFAPAGSNARPVSGAVAVVGNLHWPQETDRFTPEPDHAANIWFARDVPALARALDAEPTLVVARTLDPADPMVEPLPIDSSGIPNDHLEYAITWFGLAAVWLGMTGHLLLRLRRRAF